MIISKSNNKGFVLVASYMVIALLVILAAGFATRSIGEQRVANKERDLAQAFWLAEAGLDRAMSELPNTPLSYTLGQGGYSTETTALSSPIRFLIVSKGGIPGTDESDPNNIITQIRAIVEQPANDADPAGVTSAIAANGDVDIKGSATVEGNVDDNAVFDFEEIFGISKEAMMNNAVNLHTDPENNVTPVNNSTWLELDSIDEATISQSGWTGSGILVVNGDLRLTGGTFEGIIWVIGTLWVSGNPDVRGAIFVESGTEFDTTVTGNPEIEYDSDAISDTFGFLPSDLPAQIISWKQD